MAMVRPTLILNMDLDERSYTDDVAADLRRAYSHVAGSVVSTHQAAEGAAEDVLRLNVKLHRPYWNASVEGAEDQWQAVMPKWLRNMFFKISSNMLSFNRMRAKGGGSGIVFSWIELNFDGHFTVLIHLNADSSIPEQAPSWVERVRELYNEGAFGPDAASVSIPSAASYAAQAQPHTVRREVVLDAADADAEVKDALAESVVRQVVEVEPFDIDFSVWGVSSADGTVVEVRPESCETAS